MLKIFFLSFDFFRFAQSGFYFDFFLKKISDVFVRNVFVYTAQFFGEKYIIETFTKKIFSHSIFNVNKLLGWNNLLYSWFFTQILLVIIYTIIIFNLFILF
jgi:hypothetical protein